MHWGRSSKSRRSRWAGRRGAASGKRKTTSTAGSAGPTTISEDFNARTGVLTGAYNRGPTADKFGKLTQAQRIAKALEGGQQLHPSTGGNDPGFRGKIYIDRGVTIAWQHMPFQVGGWAGLTATRQPEIYQTIIKPQGRLYLAGDVYSYLPGWLEGAVTSVYKAIGALPPA
jgi:monoamine oxidase